MFAYVCFMCVYKFCVSRFEVLVCVWEYACLCGCGSECSMCTGLNSVHMATRIMMTLLKIVCGRVDNRV